MKKEKKNLLKDYRKDNVDEDYKCFCRHNNIFYSNVYVFFIYRYRV